MTAPRAPLVRFSLAAFGSLALLVAPSPLRAASPTVLVLTDASPAAANGASHVTNLITAFTNTGASITTNTTELTNGVAMSPGLVAGWDAVVVVTVTGPAIDAADVPVLQSAVASAASLSFLFFTDACAICRIPSANSAIAILNAVSGWSASLGTATNAFPISYTLNGAGSYSGPFAALPTIGAGAYSPILGVPAANVIYNADIAGTASDGPVMVMTPGNGRSGCMLLCTDTTEFWVTGGATTMVTANALAAATMNAAKLCWSTTAVRSRTWGEVKTIYR